MLILNCYLTLDSDRMRNSLINVSLDKSRSFSCLIFLICQRTLKYFPAKSCTPIMAKISQNIRHTNSTLKMDGIAWTSAFTTTFLILKRRRRMFWIWFLICKVLFWRHELFWANDVCLKMDFKKVCFGVGEIEDFYTINFKIN